MVSKDIARIQITIHHQDKSTESISARYKEKDANKIYDKLYQILSRERKKAIPFQKIATKAEDQE